MWGAPAAASYQFGPAVDPDLRVQLCGEEDEEQQGEEEGCAADELEEVEHRAADAAVDHLLQDEGQEGQQLRGKRSTFNTLIFQWNKKKISSGRSFSRNSSDR